MVIIPIALPILALGTVSMTSARPAEPTIAAEAPCRARPAMNIPMEFPIQSKIVERARERRPMYMNVFRELMRSEI